MARSKEQNYLHGAVILTVGVIIMKILGAIYKIPLGNMLGNEGYALFLSSYNVYGVFLTLATAGLPVALSRMISEANSQGRHLQVRRAFSVSQKAFFVLGFVCTLVMLLFPDWLAGTVLHNPDAAKSIWVLAPSVLLCCITSSYRGFSQGHGNMIPTTVGQVIEVLAKVIAGLALAWYFTSNG
ncbi:MAG: oligosaccharide flippase family protein, partial [Oscillospiraceae bacterium]|nr:oligosaccharide flippase family protein [Oscillospiraceae bacterium]